MKKRAYLALLASLGAACSSFGGDEPAVTTTTPDAGVRPGADAAPGPIDAATEGAVPPAGPCDPEAPFVDFRPVSGEVNTTAGNEYAGALTPDELTMYIERAESSGGGVVEYVQKYVRPNRDAPWTAGAVLVDKVSNLAGAWPSPDGSHVYYAHSDGGKWTLLEVDVGPDGGAVSNPAPLTGVGLDSISRLGPYLAPDESELYYSAADPVVGKYEIWVATRAQGTTFFNPQQLSALASPGGTQNPVISADGLTLYFGSGEGRSGTPGIRIAHRAARTDVFLTSAPVASLAPVQDETVGKFALPAYITADNCRFYFSTNDGGNLDVYVASRR